MAHSQGNFASERNGNCSRIIFYAAIPSTQGVLAPCVCFIKELENSPPQPSGDFYSHIKMWAKYKICAKILGGHHRTYCNHVSTRQDVALFLKSMKNIQK